MDFGGKRERPLQNLNKKGKKYVQKYACSKFIKS